LHPEDHILFQWTKGVPFEKGSTFYAEQLMIGEKVKYTGKIIDSMFFLDKPEKKPQSGMLHPIK